MTKSLFGTFNPQGRIDNADKRMRYIDLAYFICIILVVLGHSHPLDSSWWNTWYRDLNEIIYTFHMQVYFFIGGYLMVNSKSVDRLGYKKWAFSKILKFAIPYIVLTTIAFIPKAMLGDTSDVVELSLSYFLKTTFLVPRAGVWGHFWFIPAFLFLDLVWGFWRSIAPKHVWGYRIGLIIGVVVSVLMAVFPIRTDLFVLYDLSQQAAFYALGIVLALVKPYFWDKKWKNIISVIVCVPVAVLLFPYGHYHYDPTPYVNLIVGLALVWIIWSISVLVTKSVTFSLPEKLTKYNFNIYLYSWPAQAALDAVLRRLGVNWLAILAILFVSGFVFPILIVNVYKKLRFLHCKFFDLLIGVDTAR